MTTLRAFVCLGLFSVWHCAACSAAPPQGLRYRFQPGKVYIYDIKIDLDNGDTIDEAAGKGFFSVNATEDGFTVSCSGSLNPNVISKSGSPLRPSFGPPVMMTGAAGIFRGPNRIDSQGHFLQSAMSAPLPNALGDMAELVILPLPAAGQQRWEANETFTIVQDTLPGFHAPLGMGPMGRFPRPGEQDLNAHSHTVYTMGAPKGGLVTITKQFEIATEQKAGGSPEFQIMGKGQILFDRQAGVPVQMTLHGIRSRAGAGGVSNVPITISYKLSQVTVNTAAGFPQTETVTPADAAHLITALTAGDDLHKKLALNKLMMSAANSKRADVSAALIKLLSDPDSFIRQDTAKALSVWGASDAVPALTGALSDSAFNVRWAVIDALGASKNPQAAPALAKHLSEQGDRFKTSAALQSLGAVSAPLVVDYLKSDDWQLQLETCRILKAVGTRDQLPALQEATSAENGLVKAAAEEAVKAISARSGAQAPAG